MAVNTAECVEWCQAAVLEIMDIKPPAHGSKIVGTCPQMHLCGDKQQGFTEANARAVQMHHKAECPSEQRSAGDHQRPSKQLLRCKRWHHDIAACSAPLEGSGSRGADTGSAREGHAALAALQGLRGCLVRLCFPRGVEGTSAAEASGSAAQQVGAGFGSCVGPVWSGE